MINVYVGHDSREDIAYKVCEYSIKRRNKRINVKPLKHRELRSKGLFRRPWSVDSDTGLWRDSIDGKNFSTEFSHTRFLVPALNNFHGWALFMDCDMLVRADLNELLLQVDPKYAVMCVKHNHRPKESIKMDNQVQTAYPRKNWSSVMLFNCGHPSNKRLTPEFVNMATGSYLHQMEWLQDYEIGHIGHEWNWIEGSSPAMDIKNIKIIHYTLGGPWFEDEKFHHVMYAELWESELARMRSFGETDETGRPV